MLDPMCGAGTVPIAAYLLDREAYGCDVDPAAIDSAKVRLQELLNERSQAIKASPGISIRELTDKL